MKKSKMKAHVLMTEVEQTVAWLHPASAKAVKKVLKAPKNTGNGRSNWMWVRLPNGDLILGVFPQGETYEAVELDAIYPEGLLT